MKSQDGAFSVLLVILVIALVIVVAVLITGAAHGAEREQCLTHAQARAKYPSEALYWHSIHHCWNNHRGGTVKQKAPIEIDPNGNAVTKLHQTIAYPELMIGSGTDSSMLRPDPMNSWPLIADFDDEPPVFLPWQERIVLH
jgi:hypothetical protein